MPECCQVCNPAVAALVGASRSVLMRSGQVTDKSSQAPALVKRASSGGRMSEIVEKTGLMLFPLTVRRFLTFQWIAVFVVVIGIPVLIFRLTARLPADAVARLQQQEHLVKSPLFLLCYNSLLIGALLLVFFTRAQTRYYWLRVVGFGLILGGAMGQLLIIFVPWRM